jgi:uncharacterized protein (TIGR00266 family)
MNITIQHGPGSASAKVELAPSESITSEAGAMIAMSGDTQIETTTRQRGKGGGGLFSGLKRMFSNESFFLNHFTAGGQGGEVMLATTLPGDMMVYDLSPEVGLIVQGGSYVANENGVTIDLSYQGLKSLFSGENFFWLKASGQGQMIFNAFGTIYPVDIDGEYTVDTGHVVAFEETVDFKMTKAGKSWMSSFLGGEGLVMNFSGRGRIWCQSHNPHEFGSTLGSTLRERKG